MGGVIGLATCQSCINVRGNPLHFSFSTKPKKRFAMVKL